jgi:hypothetical protein
MAQNGSSFTSVSRTGKNVISKAITVRLHGNNIKNHWPEYMSTIYCHVLDAMRDDNDGF